MRKNRVEIEEAENGLTVRVWNQDDNKDEYGYCEPEIYVAKTIDEALKIAKEELDLKLEETEGEE